MSAKIMLNAQLKFCLAALIVGFLQSASWAEVTAPKATSKSSVKWETAPEAEFVKESERRFYEMSNPTRLEFDQEILDKRLKNFPNDIYALWARARISYFMKEYIYLKENQLKATGKPVPNYDREKMELGSACHQYVDRCLAITTTNAECHLVKGACFAMEASTLGPSLAAVAKIKKMNKALEAAIATPSEFRHVEGKLSTAEMATAMRGVLYRLIPNSWWFYLLTGMRGEKTTAYDWIKEGVIGKLDHEPMFVVELAATAFCLAEENKKKESVAAQYAKEGNEWLAKGLAIPIRHPMDHFDQDNLNYLKLHPEEGCNYRREKFENTTEKLNALH